MLGGDASVATNGFWSALTIATTQKLPMLFYIEDNGYGISVPSTSRRRAATSPRTWRPSATCRSSPATAPSRRGGALIAQAVAHVRGGKGPALLRLPCRGSRATPSRTPRPTRPRRLSRRRGRAIRCPAQAVPGAGARSATKRGQRSKAGAPGGRRRARHAPKRRRRIPTSVTRHVFYDGDRWQADSFSGRAASGPRAIAPPGSDETAHARGRADQHGHRDPPHARPRARDQSARAGVRRGCRAQGRRPRGDAGPAGQVRRRRACSTPASPRKASSAARSAWRWPG